MITALHVERVTEFQVYRFVGSVQARN
jgi:hypothetical protein